MDSVIVVFSRRVTGKCCQVQTKVTVVNFHHWSTLIEQHIVKLCSDITLVYTREQCCVDSDKLVNCDCWLKYCSTWKEPGLVWDIIQPLSCPRTNTLWPFWTSSYTASSHPIIGLDWKGQLSISIDIRY